MKILATSDLHGDLPEIEECDLLLICGDICPVIGSHSPKTQSKWIINKFSPWLKALPAKKILLIAGNHDFVFESKGKGTIYEKLKQNALASLPDNALYLQDQAVIVDGLTIYGTPWVPHLSGWAFYDHLGVRMFNIPECDILMSHTPPLGYSDQTTISHVGSPQLHDMLTKYDGKIKVLVCGHIHEGYGQYTHPSGTEIYNVAHMNRMYSPINPVVEVKLND